VDYGGAQTLLDVRPDLTCLGKIIGGGLPVGAYGGRKEIMDYVAPSGPVYQAGTLSGNPVATAAGIATLKALQRPGLYAELEQRTTRLVEGLREAAREAGVAVTINNMGSCFTLFFASKKVTDYQTARLADVSRYARFFHAMLARGVFLAPSQFETLFVSTAHGDDDIERSLEAAREAFRKLVS
jgi:glutamate-1-semialdehyde 2,1-aminomutase